MFKLTTRRQALRQIAALGVGAGLGRVGVVESADRVGAAGGPTRPNILFFLIDDLSYNSLGCSGHPFVRTPNIDRIAKEGARFANAFVTTSLCSPSRASFLTGLYAHSHGVRANSGDELQSDLSTFPMLLQGAGYDTAHIGKWHMAHHARPRPGFNYWLSFVDQGQYMDPPLSENGRDFTASGYMTDLLTDHAVNWLRQPRSRPFCLTLAHKAVHAPFTPAERHRGLFAGVQIPMPKSFEDTFANKPEWYRVAILRYLRADEWMRSKEHTIPAILPLEEWNPRQEQMLNYFRTLSAVDEGIGRIFHALEEAGQLDSTVIVFASDNGFFLGEHRLTDKRLAYEESIRIPLIVRYPKLVRAGQVIREMALNIDLAPTLLQLAGLRVPSGMHGRSLLALLQGRSVRWRTSFLYEYFKEDWLESIPTMFAIRTERWKYVRCPGLEDLDELYDLEKDPCELQNLAAEPGSLRRLKEMRADLERLMKEANYTLQPRHPGPSPRRNEA